ncbi:MAG: YebC/PmpR family DNA-binding transcriptional regulator [Capsulimonadales bacterium]|nr:YebC/PmpR family DNA-binding transcriptional regulator [Capsulimonadales bacterium]
MAGHSKWHNIRLRKGKQDAVRGKTFTKLAKEIIIAAKEGGGNPDANVRLRTAIDAAKKASMPNDNIKRAIQRGTGEIEGVSYVERTLEGYAPGGVAVMVQCLTDNQQRTVADVRAIFTKSGGNMGEAGSVSYLFQHKGVFLIDPGVTTEDRLMEVALDAGADDVQPTEEGGFEVTTAFGDFGAVRQALDSAGIAVASGEPTMIPVTTIELSETDAEKVFKLIDRLEEHDDVQNVFFNLEANDAALAAV